MAALKIETLRAYSRLQKRRQKCSAYSAGTGHSHKLVVKADVRR